MEDRATTTLTIQEVAERLHVERHKASDLMKTMPCIVFPGTRTRRVRLIDLEAWMEENMAIPGQTMERPRKKRKIAQDTDQALFEPDGRLKRRRA